MGGTTAEYLDMSAKAEERRLVNQLKVLLYDSESKENYVESENSCPKGREGRKCRKGNGKGKGKGKGKGSDEKSEEDASEEDVSKSSEEIITTEAPIPEITTAGFLDIEALSEERRLVNQLKGLLEDPESKENYV